MFEPTGKMSKYEQQARLALFDMVTEMAEQIASMNSEERHHGNAEKHDERFDSYL